MLSIDFFLNLIANAFDFFTMELFTLSFFPNHHPKQMRSVRYAFLFAYLLIAVTPYTFLLGLLINFFYIYLTSSFQFKNSILFFLKYTLFIQSGYFFASIFCAAVNSNVPVTLNYNNVYFSYQSLTGTMLVYILINLKINTRRLRNMHIHTIYPFTFSVLSTTIIFLLLFFNRNFAKYAELAPFLPSLYVCVTGILVLSLNSYRKIIMSLESQTTQKLLLEKYETELSYFQNIQDSLDTLSRIRHDFRNHLIVLDTYASQNRIDELREYMTKINTELTNTKLIQTPSNLISSILNTKNVLCKKNGIKFHADYAFEKIYISDFSVITVLGNILDNAITAALQAKEPTIELSITQIDNYLEIYCKNSYNGKIKEKNGHFISTKEDTKALHGLGIKNIKDCISTLNGTIEFQYNSQFFSVEILVPNYEHATDHEKL